MGLRLEQAPEVWQIPPLGLAASMSSSLSDPYFKTQKMSVFFWGLLE